MSTAMQPGRPILVLEDDPDVARTITGLLSRDGWSTRHVTTLAEGFSSLHADDPCMLIIDLSLPDGSGMKLVREAAGRESTGVIVISGSTEETDRIVGLEVGADDYIQKPFSGREMIARVHAVYRRLNGHHPALAPARTPAPPPPPHESKPALQLEFATLDPARLRIVGAQGENVKLTGAEADLLGKLIAAGEQPVAREAVAEPVLGHRLQPQQRGIDQLASSLRRKLELAVGEAGQAGPGIRIIAVRGKGYRLIY